MSPTVPFGIFFLPKTCSPFVFLAAGWFRLLSLALAASLPFMLCMLLATVESLVLRLSGAFHFPGLVS